MLSAKVYSLDHEVSADKKTNLTGNSTSLQKHAYIVLTPFIQ